jgi:iron complex outermembrane receptor protein
LIGAFYFRQDASNVFVFPDAVSLQPLYPVGTDLTNGLQRALSEAYAVFGQASYAFDPRWSLTIGERWSRESKSASLAALPDAVTNAPTPFAGAKAWDQLTPRVALERRGAFGLAYLSYARGFKSGGYSYPASLGPVLDPEVVDSYEVGVKTELLGERLRLDSALFVYDFTNLQVTRNGSGAFLTTENAADARVSGAELDFALALAPALSLTGGLAVIHSEYTSYVAGVLVPQLAPPYGSAPLAGGLDVSGRPLLRSPKRAAYVGLRYEARLAGGASLPLSASYSYKDSYYFDFSAVAATEWLKQPPTSILNARVAYKAPRGRWEIGLWGTNLTNAVYYDDAVLTNVSSRVSYADPRMYGVDFKLNIRAQ